ncbi:MAG: two-component regulator propeller domain-containing protein, partial [Bacteroidota bacterium]
MTENNRLKLFLLLIFLVGKFLSFSQGDYRFNNYTISNGLSQSFVTTIIQDQNNSLWIGTQDGLNRFDGKTFEVFNQDETPGLESTNFQCSARTPDGRLWFGTASGLIHYNPNSERFTTFNISSQILLDVQSLDFDQNGNLWLATIGYGILKFDTKKLKFGKEKINLESKKVHLVTCLNNGNLLIDTEDKGLIYYNSLSKSTQKLDLKTKNQTVVSILKMVELTNGIVLLCTNQGVFQFNPNSLKIDSRFKSLDKIGIFSVKDVIQADGKYFIATMSNGLFTVNENGNIFNSTEDIFQKNSLLFNGLSCLYQDFNNKIWVGSERGLSGFDPSRIGFLGIGPSGNLTKGLPSPNVWCFSEDPNSKFVFVGTDAGVSRFNRKTGSFDQFNRSIGTLSNSETGKE